MYRRRVLIIGSYINLHYWMREFTKSYGKFVIYKRYNSALVNVYDKVEVEYNYVTYVDLHHLMGLKFNEYDTIYIEDSVPHIAWLHIIEYAYKLNLDQIRGLDELSIVHERREVVKGCLN